MSNDSIIPDYKPRHVPNPEFKGTSNYEVGSETFGRNKGETRKIEIRSYYYK